MDITQGNTFWNEDIGIIKSYPYLSKNISCDTLVIGGGITGALTAFMQAKQGAKVVVVDKNLIGFNNTINYNGIMETRLDFNDKTNKHVEENVILKCNAIFSNALEDVKKIIDEIMKDEDCRKYIKALNFKQTDFLYYADKLSSKIAMYKKFEKLGKINGDIEYLEEDPIINLRTGIVFPKAGGVVNPYVLTELIFMYISKMDNVKIYENTNVISITGSDEKVESITNNRFKIYSKCVILTDAVLGAKYLKQDTINAAKIFSIVTEGVKFDAENLTDIIGKNILYDSYICFTKENSNVIFTGDEVKQSDKIFLDDKPQEYINGKYKKLYMKLNRAINIPQDIRIINCFNCNYVETKDDLPIIDEAHNIVNVYFNIPSGNNKIIHSMIGANMLKDVSNKYHVKDMYLFRENR